MSRATRRTAVALLVRGEEPGDLLGEDPVLFHVRARVAVPPGIEPGRTHGVTPTERAHAEARADGHARRREERGDEREDLAFPGIPG